MPALGLLVSLTVSLPLSASAVEPSAVRERPLVDCVDPMIGAITLEGYGGHGLGKTFPGAATPFGMVQLSPDTITGGDNGPGYSYHHETIEGFSMTHMSGIGWYGDLGNFQVMPADGPARFSHSNEVAKAGYYSVMLDDPKVKVELRAYPWQHGVYRFTYPKSEKSVLKIDLARRIGELSRAKRFSRQTLTIEDDHSFSGSIQCDHRDGGWGHGDGLVDYTLYFYAKFLPTCEHSLKDAVVTGAPSNAVLRLEFPTEENETVWMNVWISYESVRKARELSHAYRRLNFNYNPWTLVFDKIDVKGGTDRQRRIFATAVYHACLDPRKIDLPGQSRTVFSGWDVFRSEMPFLTLFFPEVVTDTINAMMGVMESGRRDTLPVWDLFGCKSGCMVGNPLIPVIATAQEAGLGGVDYAKALDLAVKTTAKRGNLDCGYTPESLSKTLEYCFDDWCVSEIARRLGKDDIAARFRDRAGWYTNSWCAAVGSMRARAKDGGWLEPWKGATTHWQGTVESNPLQQGWFVPHDVAGLARLMGGRKQAIAKLEEFFEKAPDDFLWGDYYNHPNEPSHHIVFMFSELGRPYLTQKWTRRILEKAYNDDVRGLCGNDDVGQMSAWYVLAALGLNPMCPGSGRWILSAPLFPEARLMLGNGNVLTIRAKGAEAPKNVRICSVTLDGRLLDRFYLSTSEILSSHELVLELAKFDIICGNVGDASHD